MTPCPRCIGGRVCVEDGRRVCLSCGWSAGPEPGTLEKMLSNMTPEADDGSHKGFAGWFGPRVPADIEAIKARVMARIRQEAANAR